MTVRLKFIFKIFSMLLIIISVFSGSKTMALEPETHSTINKYIAKNELSGFSLDNYLKNQLGMTDGIKTEFNNTGKKQVVSEWIGDGGKYEDKPPECTIPYLRSRNHFHNPINGSGFWGVWDQPIIISGMSAYNWLFPCPSSAHG